MAAIFLDTYAIFEIIRGNRNYGKYKTGFRYFTTSFNLTELYYNLRRTGQEKEAAQDYFFRFSEFRVPIEPKILIESGEFKLRNKKKRLSYADCIGYVTAKNLGVPFLTGDWEFEGMENVIFLK